jgi:predicted ferric reductase
MMSKNDAVPGTLPPAMAFGTLALLLLGVAAGAGVAVMVLPAWLPALAGSLEGSAPSAYWYLSRATGIVAYGLLWLSMAFGVMITSRAARAWPGGLIAFDLHQHTSLLGLAFGLFHGLILAGDRYINYTLPQLLIPFGSANYRPIWVGLGQLAFYALVIVGLSFYARRIIGQRLWRLIHYASFGVFLLALLHGTMAGSDSAVPLVSGLYWWSGGLLLFLTLYRALSSALASPAR